MSKSQNKENEQALILFVRQPSLGEVKSRLARTVGDRKALNLYREMLDHLRSLSMEIQVDRWVFFDREPEGAFRSYWSHDYFNFKTQEGEDLGQRMYGAFQFVLDEMQYDQALLIGSDCPGLRPSILQEGYSALTTHDAVLGPSSDGGYYLIGLKKVIRSLFYHIPWSTEIVRSLTEDRLEQDGYSWHLLPELTDIDTEGDLESWDRNDA